MEILNGSEIANEIKLRLKQENERKNLVPSLVVIVVGDDKESVVYAGVKEMAAEFIGGKCQLDLLPASISREKLIKHIEDLNRNNEIDGVLLQLPLPGELEQFTEDFLSTIDPAKDVDGFNPGNRGRLYQGQAPFISPAARACMEVINRTKGSLSNWQITLVGDSFDLIIPLAIVLTKQGSRVSIIPDYKKANLPASDIYVIEKGDPLAFNDQHIKAGALVIDAGFHWNQGKVCGNVNRDKMVELSGHLMSVPGGIGPILIAELMNNLCQAANR